MMCIFELCVCAASFAPCYLSTAFNAHASLAGVIQRRRQHHRSVPHVHCSSQRRDRLFRRPRRLAFCFVVSTDTASPAAARVDGSRCARRWVSPAACCCALCSRGCHRSSCRTSRKRWGFKFIERFRRRFRVSRCAHSCSAARCRLAFSRALFSGSSSRNQTSGGGAVISCAGVVVHKAVE